MAFNSPEYKKHQSEVMKKNWRSGKFDFLRKPKERRLCRNKVCANTFLVYPSDRQKFCSHSCASFFLNRRLGHVHKDKLDLCLNCDHSLKKGNFKYCSLKCQNAKQYKTYIRMWKSGVVSGGVGIEVKTISGHIRKYLFEKYKEQCSLCGWNARNPVTNNVPLEVDHIDGDSNNNKENNLRLICPNCHSLSKNYKNLNKGNGRAWRMAKYIKSANAD